MKGRTHLNSGPFRVLTKGSTVKFLAEYKGILNCQARFAFGSDVTNWKNADYIGYEGHAVHNITKERGEITRLIFNISGESRAVAAWTSDIRSVVEVLLKKYPHLIELHLQPVIGGVGDTPGVRAIRNQPHIVEAISAVIAASAPSLLRFGAVIKMRDEDFSDRIGHLTAPGAQKARELAFSFYGISITC